MSHFRRWLLIGGVVVLSGAAIRLGLWQLDRLSTRRGANAALQAARSLPPIDLARDTIAAGRMARAEGEFLPADQVLLRSRVHRAAPGLHVVTAFRVTEGQQVIWVLRGFVAAADGVQPEAVPEPQPGVVTIQGVLQPLPTTANGGQPAVTNGDTTWRRLDSAMAHLRRPEAPPVVLYLEGSETGPGRLPTVEPPALDDGPHLSYALQWFAIALAIGAFGVYALRKPARRARAPSAAAP